MPWLSHPIRLQGALVRLEPLQEAHFDELIHSAADSRIWTHLPVDGNDGEKLRRELITAVLNRTVGSHYPFTVFAQDGNRIIGSTRFFDIFEEHKKLEIGWTWYHPNAWGKGYNTECKLLLLTHAFEVLSANRVQLKTRTTNLRSRAAIEKIGAVQEGILRADRIGRDGHIRDTVLYSIIAPEWPATKAHLQQMLSGVTVGL
jgi:RimJ/RimL family protein N-acetyltransferase